MVRLNRDRVGTGEPPAMPIASTPSIPGAGGRRRDRGTAGRREVSGIPCVRRVEIQIPMLNRSG
ncbi:hypothetical protein C6P98_20790 [Burkholderia multivorans]|uniref:Uncharacterized protein n=1 Tax=Burkholderia multivorans TaxID=87883 RepID=A0A8E2RSW2_9BURK|nr:hypothetical protein C6P98_20790 [Burkholderia multivorans]